MLLPVTCSRNRRCDIIIANICGTNDDHRLFVVDDEDDGFFVGSHISTTATPVMSDDESVDKDVS